jgi:hypothetical protein
MGMAGGEGKSPLPPYLYYTGYAKTDYFKGGEAAEDRDCFVATLLAMTSLGWEGIKVRDKLLMLLGGPGREKEQSGEAK